jgi:hypothetical protein
MDYKAFFESDDYACSKTKKQGAEADGSFFTAAPVFKPMTEAQPSKNECGPVRSPETTARVTLSMELDREGLPLAIAYVPMQAWREVYEPEIAITRATVFKELDKPFCLEEAKNRGR